MIIDENITRITIGNTEIQKIMSGGVFCGRNFISGEYMRYIKQIYIDIA